MRTSSRPAATPRVVGASATVIFAAGGLGRAAVNGDIWQILYPRDAVLLPGDRVRVMGQGAGQLLVLPLDRATGHPVGSIPAMRAGRRR